MNGRPLVYLDSAASAQKPRAVIDAMTAAMEGSYANVHRGLHTLANETTEAYEAARESVRRLHQRRRAGEIVFTKGAHRGDQPGRRLARPDAAGRRRDRASPSWSTTPTSCPGTSCASARAWC